MKTDTHAFTAQLTKRMSQRLAGSWPPTPTSTRRACCPRPEAVSLAAQRATARFSDFGQNPNDLVNAGGKLLGDRPHTFKAQVVGRAALRASWWAPTTSSRAAAPGRAARASPSPTSGFPTAPEINIEERDGSRRVPNQSILDLRLQKSFALGKNVQVLRSSATP